MSRAWIAGTGAVGPLGLGLSGPAGPPSAAGALAVPEGLALKAGFPPGALRWLDASSLWWVNAARQALGARAGAQVAQVVGLGWGSTPPVRALIEQVHGQGYSAMAPALFPYSVGNAPAAQAGLLVGLRGAGLTVNAKEAAGLAAIVEACRGLEGGLFGACVAGGVDQIDPLLGRVLRGYRRGAGIPAGEGAYALLLEFQETPPAGAMASVVAWSGRSAQCAPHRFPEGRALLDAVADDLLARAGWDSGSVDLVAFSEDTPALRTEGEALTARRFPKARALRAQRTLGAGGAAWAGAAALTSESLGAGKARRAVLVALATGGCAWGLALEASGGV